MDEQCGEKEVVHTVPASWIEAGCVQGILLRQARAFLWMCRADTGPDLIEPLVGETFEDETAVLVVFAAIDGGDTTSRPQLGVECRTAVEGEDEDMSLAQSTRKSSFDKHGTGWSCRHGKNTGMDRVQQGIRQVLPLVEDVVRLYSANGPEGQSGAQTTEEETDLRRLSFISTDLALQLGRKPSWASSWLLNLLRVLGRIHVTMMRDSIYI